MTSSTQLIGQGSSSTAPVGSADPFGRARTGRETAEQSRQPAAAGTPAPASPSESGRSPSPAGIVRLPGQEGPADAGPRRPLISGGAFTLAVAIGLSVDQSAQPDSLEPATPSSTTGAPEEGGGEAAETAASGLTEEEQKLVDELRARDAEVRRHEAAHAAAGGQYAGSPTYTYQSGPDGRQYAIGGEVSIDTGPVRGDPEATIRKAQQIKAAATAPADPSSQDRRVAAQAESLRQQAQAELAAERQEERELAAAEAAGTEAAPAGPPAVAGQAAPAIEVAGIEVAGTEVIGSAEAGSTPGAGAPDGRLAPDQGSGSNGFAGALGDETEDGGDEQGAAPAFAAAAFSAAAASYRGPAAAPRLVSIAV